MRNAGLRDMEMDARGGGAAAGGGALAATGARCGGTDVTGRGTGAGSVDDVALCGVAPAGPVLTAVACGCGFSKTCTRGSEKVKGKGGVDDVRKKKKRDRQT